MGGGNFSVNEQTLSLVSFKPFNSTSTALSMNIGQSTSPIRSAKLFQDDKRVTLHKHEETRPCETEPSFICAKIDPLHTAILFASCTAATVRSTFQPRDVPRGRARGALAPPKYFGPYPPSPRHLSPLLAHILKRCHMNPGLDSYLRRFFFFFRNEPNPPKGNLRGKKRKFGTGPKCSAVKTIK